MSRTRRCAGVLLLAALLFEGCASGPPGPVVPPAPGPVAGPRRLALPPSPLEPRQQIVHALDRLAFGARPGDLERVGALGVAAWIALQLEPEGLPDEPVERRLAAYPSLGMSIPELYRAYPRPIQAGPTPGAGAMDPRAGPERRPGRIAVELAAARLVRAVWSERQLQEVLVDVWLNHFNVYAGKGAVRWMVGAYEREAIRPHALGRFHDLLVATARHPAMLFYLDNWLSVRDGVVPLRGPRAGRRLGPNENYARELLELHTLGVDGGYSQQDVVEVARCFTGWTLARPLEQGRFVFRPELHDRGAKRVLGHLIPPGGGEEDGLRVLELLARHPATARTVAARLARRLVADDPPPGVVDRGARAYLETDGDIRSVVRAIVTSPEFWSDAAFRAKLKKPLELVASAARAVGLEPSADDRGLAGLALARAVAAMGERLYGAEPPTGHPEGARAWLAPGSLAPRMNFALALAGGRLPGVDLDLHRLIEPAGGASAEAIVDRLGSSLAPAGLGAATRRLLRAELEAAGGAGPAALARLTALALASPEFQRR
jgi:uncharacterized protein (DUF1800 family)